jgi:predicted transcriptional regulator
VSKRITDVTETELAILGVLWDRGPSGIREIVESIYGEHTPALHATVKSLLERLGEKGYVDCDKSHFAHQFAARVDRETYVGEQLQRLADSHFDGSLAPMLLTLVERVQLTRRDRETLRNIIDNIR